MSSVDRWVLLDGPEPMWVNLARVSCVTAFPKYIYLDGGAGKMLTPEQYDKLVGYLQVCGWAIRG